jgi:hypothetical protein
MEPTPIAVFADHERIPIDHTGHYTWTSPEFPLATNPPLFTYSFKVDGVADVQNIDCRPRAPTDSTMRFVCQFDVQSYEGAPELVLVRADADRGSDSQ